jgi:hypothetical protein
MIRTTTWAWPLTLVAAVFLSCAVLPKEQTLESKPVLTPIMGPIAPLGPVDTIDVDQLSTQVTNNVQNSVRGWFWVVIGLQLFGLLKDFGWMIKDSIDMRTMKKCVRNGR